jgi:hypothetical protein
MDEVVKERRKTAVVVIADFGRLAYIEYRSSP